MLVPFGCGVGSQSFIVDVPRIYTRKRENYGSSKIFLSLLGQADDQYLVGILNSNVDGASDMSTLRLCFRRLDILPQLLNRGKKPKAGDFPGARD